MHRGIELVLPFVPGPRRVLKPNSFAPGILGVEALRRNKGGYVFSRRAARLPQPLAIRLIAKGTSVVVAH